MADMIRRSAIYTDYELGRFGAATAQPVILSEVVTHSMMNFVVWDETGVNALLNELFKLALPAPGYSTNNDQMTILWIGPSRYLIICASDQAQSNFESRINDQLGSIQNLSAARTVMRIQGDSARYVMAKGLTVDLSEQAFAAGQVILSSFDHHFPAIIHQHPTQAQCFDIYITRSFALSFWVWLKDSSIETGYQVV